MKKIILVLFTLSSLAFASNVSFNGIAVTLNSNGLKVGDYAPQFTATSVELEDVVIGGKQDRIQVIAFIPSLDTATCKLEAIEFNRKIAQLSTVKLTIVSKDLPFTQQKFCKDNSITNIQTVSDYKDANHALRYGATISAPTFLEGLFARVIYIVDRQGKITYKQVVREITLQPDYNEVINALKKTF